MLSTIAGSILPAVLAPSAPAAAQGRHRTVSYGALPAGGVTIRIAFSAGAGGDSIRQLTDPSSILFGG